VKIKSFNATWAGPFSGITLDIGRMKGVWTISGSDADAPEEDYSNGVGKTSLYDLLGYALSGKSIEDRQVGELVHDQAAIQGSNKKMSTEILIDNIRIRRGHKPKKFEVHRMDPDGSEREDLTSTASQEWLWEKWGINWDTLKFIMRFGGDENDLKSFAKANAETRRKIQDALIQADRISACLKAARKGAGDIKSRCEVLSGRFQDAGQRVEFIQGELEDLKARQQAFEKDIQEKIEELDKFVKSWSKFNFEEAYQVADDYEKIVTNINELNNQVKAHKKRITALDERINTLTEEIITNERAIDRLRREVVDEGPLQRDVERAYARLGQLRMEAEQARNNMQKRKPVEKELEEAERTVGKYQAEVKKFQEKISAVEDLRSPVNTADIESTISRLQDQIKEKQEIIDKARLKVKSLSTKKSPSVFEAELNAAKKDRSKVKGLLEQIADAMIDTKAAKAGVACDTCGQQVTEESKAGVLARQLEDQAKLEEELSKINGEIEDIERDLQKAKEHALDLDAAEKQKDKSENDLADLRGDLEIERQKLDAVRQETLSYEKKVAEKDIAERSLKAHQNLLDGAKSAVLRLRNQLNDMEDGTSKQELVDEAEGVHKRATQQLNEVSGENEAVMEKIDEHRGDIKSAEDRRKEAKDEKTKILTTIDEIEQDKKKEERRRKCLLYEDGEEPETREYLEKKKERLQRSEEELIELQKKLKDNDVKQLFKKKKDEYEKAIEAAKAMEAEFDEQSALLPYYEYWVSAFKSDGIRSLAMKDLIPVLNQEMDRVMEYLEGKRARVQFDDDMELIITDWETGDPTTYRKISGGMKKRVNIAIACAFRETIRAASGCDLSLFVVDESADALDTPGKLGFVDLLQDMSEESTIWVITHDKVLREALDGVASGNIHIEMQGGVSQAFVTYNR